MIGWLSGLVDCCVHCVCVSLVVWGIIKVLIGWWHLSKQLHHRQQLHSVVMSRGEANNMSVAVIDEIERFGWV